MRVVKGREIEFEAASHEDPHAPGVLKRILLRKPDLFPGRVQMVNWAKLPSGSSFRRHYHEDMEEIFIILDGRIEAIVDSTTVMLEPGDCIVVSPGERHQMKNLEAHDVHYVVFGIAGEQSGRTIVE